MIPPEDIVDVRAPPGQATGKVAELWKPVEGSNKIVCTACARYCKIGEGQVGLCGIRGVHDGKLWLYVYGRVITGHVDPIEKKPVSHYRPGSKIFSIATTGCNWLCHPAGTKILLADGATKPVEDIRPGDALLSLGGAQDWAVPDIVTEIGRRRAASYRIQVEGVKEPLLATAEHPVLTSRGWIPASFLRIGERVLRAQHLNWETAWPQELNLPRHSSTAHPRETSAFYQLLDSKDAVQPSLAWSPITRIGPEERSWVYSFECVPFHNYLANDIVVHNCRYCFLPGTMVLTDTGPLPIESIFDSGEPTADEEVRHVRTFRALSHKGRWRRVKKAFRHFYSGRVLTVRPFYLPGFECTPDHRVFASVAGGPVRKVQARHLKIGDFLAIPRPKRGRAHEIDVERVVRKRLRPAYKYAAKLTNMNGRVRWSSERGPGLPARLPLSPGIARLLGYYCAEGSVNWHAERPNSGTVWFSFGQHEVARINEVERTLREELGVRTRRIQQDNRVAVIAPGATLATFFAELCGTASDNKRVPRSIVESGDPRVARAFLTGYFNGDGYVTMAKGSQLVLGSSSVSRGLTFGVAQLLFTIGDVPRVHRAKNEPTYRIEGRTVSRSDDHMVRLWVDEVRLDPQEAEWKASKVRVLRRRGFFLIPIRTITETEYIGPVYNIEVEEDHSYTANFVAVANCQNADISQRRKVEGIEVEPQDVVRMTLEQGCQGLAYTYNQPTIFIEFARDIGLLARKAGLINIFVSNGYDTPETVAEMGKFLDAVTVDFKGSGETEFVRKYINIPNADPIFQTLLDIRDRTRIHTEITDLIVPQVGDNLDAARKLSRWVLDNLGPDTPIHFLRFHPDYKMMEFPWTPVETLEKHCAVAKEVGLKYVYIGNVPGHPLEHTYCPGCGSIAVKRHGFDIAGWYLDKDNKCRKCGYKIAITGRLEKTAKENRFYGVLYHR